MAFRIDEFKANINRHQGLALTTGYQAIIPTAGIGGIGVEDLSLLCESAVLPGLNLQTNEFRYTGYGKMEKRPYMSAFTDAALIFLLDGSGDVVRFFHEWLRFINEFPEDSSEETIDTFRYPNEYVRDIDIIQYRRDGEAIQTWKLFRAFPITIGDVTVAWGERNVPLRLPVQFSYNSWTTDKL